MPHPTQQPLCGCVLVCAPCLAGVKELTFTLSPAVPEPELGAGTCGWGWWFGQGGDEPSMEELQAGPGQPRRQQSSCV
jgi:hypothetical protein